MPLVGSLAITVGEGAVEFRFSVENENTEPVELEFRSGQVADVVVYEGDEEVWRYSDGRMFTQAIQREQLSPGESFAYEMTWEDPEEGDFTAEASLAATNVDLTTTASFSVP